MDAAFVAMTTAPEADSARMAGLGLLQSALIDWPIDAFWDALIANRERTLPSFPPAGIRAGRFLKAPVL